MNYLLNHEWPLHTWRPLVGHRAQLQTERYCNWSERSWTAANQKASGSTAATHRLTWQNTVLESDGRRNDPTNERSGRRAPVKTARRQSVRGQLQWGSVAAVWQNSVWQTVGRLPCSALTGLRALLLDCQEGTSVFVRPSRNCSATEQSALCSRAAADRLSLSRSEPRVRRKRRGEEGRLNPCVESGCRERERERGGESGFLRFDKSPNGRPEISLILWITPQPCAFQACNFWQIRESENWILRCEMIYRRDSKAHYSKLFKPLTAEMFIEATQRSSRRSVLYMGRIEFLKILQVLQVPCTVYLWKLNQL